MEESEPRHLIAKNNSIITTYLMKERLHDESFSPMQIAIDLICPVVSSDKINKKLLLDIEKNGLENPLIVIPNSYSNFIQARQGVKNARSQHLKTFPLLAYTGNQRINIFRKLKIDTVTCIIAEDVHWAHSYQLTLQKGVIINEITN